jgi:1-deoxyxylulose-5-phosphate synthase
MPLESGSQYAVAISVGAVATVAAAHGVPRAQVARAWVSHNLAVSAPIGGARTPGHLDDAIASLDLVLTDDEVEALEAPYTPHALAGF